MIGRRPLQVGPTRFVAKQGERGWHVEAQWFSMVAEDQEEDFSERVTGPMAFELAEAKATRLNHERAAFEAAQRGERACAGVR